MINRNATTSWLSLLTLTCLVGCTTISKQECESINWYEKGFKAGIHGGPVSNALVTYNRTCASKHGVEPNVKAIDDGYTAGLKALCTPEGGLRFGKVGGSYNSVCPKEVEDAFLKQYQIGLSYYSASRIRNLESEVKQLRTDLNYRDMEINRLRMELQNKSN